MSCRRATSILDAEEWGRIPELGMYVVDAPTWEVVRNAPECPYCYAPLKLLHGRKTARVIALSDPIGPKVKAVSEFVPRGHLTWGCQACAQMFTTPS